MMRRRAAILPIAPMLFLASGLWGMAQAQTIPDPPEEVVRPQQVPPPDVEAPPAADAAPAVDVLPSGTIAAPEGGVQVVAPVLTVDEQALLARSAWGKRLQAELAAEGAELQAENDRLAAQLAEEESALTQQRATLDQARFRELAEAFDTKATNIRREREQAAADLNAKAEASRADFYRAALPVMGKMMQERGAVAVLDQRTVFVSLDVIDITADLVQRLDEELGDGADAAGDEPPADDGAAPDTGDQTAPSETSETPEGN